jgi:hypothetical protein
VLALAALVPVAGIAQSGIEPNDAKPFANPFTLPTMDAPGIIAGVSAANSGPGPDHFKVELGVFQLGVSRDRPFNVDRNLAPEAGLDSPFLGGNLAFPAGDAQLVRAPIQLGVACRSNLASSLAISGGVTSGRPSSGSWLTVRRNPSARSVRSCLAGS